MAYHRLVHPEGEVATARAAGEAGMLFVAGIFASRTVEAIARATDSPLWLQLYWLRDRDRPRRLVGRAEDAGYGVLVLTVDAPVVAHRPRCAQRVRDPGRGTRGPLRRRRHRRQPRATALAPDGRLVLLEKPSTAPA